MPSETKQTMRIVHVYISDTEIQSEWILASINCVSDT
jgi:hypothetical protein